MTSNSLSVALPWSLSHYIALNGFHPLYRALIDQAPSRITFNAWDNIKLHNRFQRDLEIRNQVLKESNNENEKLNTFDQKTIIRKYGDYFWPPNMVLLSELPGDIEFHHTAPFPSLKRPFVFHCESFSPVFTPFAAQGNGGFLEHEMLREHYRNIFKNPFCLGIFSHIPNTLDSFRCFFSDTEIDKKLIMTKIGVSEKAFSGINKNQEKADLSNPKFLFINSAHQNPKNFFNRGGHIVLRFWREFRKNGRKGQLILRCLKPDKKDLAKHQVDTDFLDAETGESILWAEDYLSDHELNALMSKMHFFLLPSVSLHSVSIMQTMILGMIPVITDTIGTSVYVTDQENGIVLKGLKDELWSIDPKTGILIDSYFERPWLDDFLLSQMTQRIFELLDNPQEYSDLRQRVLTHSQRQFSGKEFSDDFWNSVTEMYRKKEFQVSKVKFRHGLIGQRLQDCTVREDDWTRVLQSVPQPMQRIFTGQSFVWELGGAFLCSETNAELQLSDWSVFARYFSYDAPKMTFVKTIGELGGKYLSSRRTGRNRSNKLLSLFSKILKPFPFAHDFAREKYAKAHKCRILLRRIYLSILYHLSSSSREPDIELALYSVSGFNIVRFFYKYYAIPQNEGAFDPDRLKRNDYSISFSGYSVDAVLMKLSKSEGLNRQMEINKEEDNESPYLVVEGYHGYNIIFFHNKYFAIMQTDGPFNHEKILSGQYTQSVIGHSLEYVKTLILNKINHN